MRAHAGVRDMKGDIMAKKKEPRKTKPEDLKFVGAQKNSLIRKAARQLANDEKRKRAEKLLKEI